MNLHVREPLHSNRAVIAGWLQSPRAHTILIDFSLTVKAETLIFISGRGSAILSAKQGESGSIYNSVKNL